jgi:predicted O-methyltransferase YrrM
MAKSSFLDSKVRNYILEHSVREPEVLAELRRETAKMSHAGMQISPDQGQFMALLVQMLGATRYVEIGTFTGYSSLAVALAMPTEGRLVCCDVSEEWTSVARRYWTRAGVADKIDLKIGPGLQSLDALLAAGEADRFDFAFIDADKTAHDAYYERCLKLVRRGGLIGVDNSLWGGAVADPADNSPDTVAIRALNDKLKSDERVSISLLAVGDGLMLALKR